MGIDDFQDSDVPNWLPQTHVPFNLFQLFRNFSHFKDCKHYVNQLDVVASKIQHFLIGATKYMKHTWFILIKYLLVKKLPQV